MPSPVEIIGHQDQLDALVQDLQTGNVAHAYLFVGQPHVGKFTVAARFAEELLLTGVAPEDQERVSGAIERLLHPDLLVLDQLWMEDVCEDFDVIARTSNVSQQHRMKAKAKTNTISIDDIRTIQERLAEVGTGTYRCCLIRSVERMQAEAVNALLKLLEEPPEGVVFLLTAESLGELLPTLVSRVRILRFARVGTDELRPLLAGVPAETAQFILRFAQGAPGTVIRLRDDPDFLRSERILAVSAQTFWGSTRLSERLQILGPLLERSEEADHLLLHLGLSLREQAQGADNRAAHAYHCLVRDLGTNAQRNLLVQRFALALT